MRTDGDYISRKTAYQFFKDQLEEETGAYSKGRNAGLRVAMSAVMNNDAIPAADVRPVVNGTWKKEFRINACCEWYDCTCSRCGMTFKNFNPSNYCPNCGAWMEEN